MVHPFFMSYTERIHTNIKSWAEEDRPREKLLLKGSHSLSDSELIAILIGSGTKNLSAVELARTILSIADNNLIQLGKIGIDRLLQIKGIGEAKAIHIIAALELGKRRRRSEVLEETLISSSKKAYELLLPELVDKYHEEFWVILLNRKNNLIKYKMISQGGFAGTVVDVRQVFNWAISEKAHSIILAHNHPSGNLIPSTSDSQLTHRFVKAGEILDIPVVDHIIITSSDYYSFADHSEM